MCPACLIGVRAVTLNDLSLRVKAYKTKNILAYIKAYAGKVVSCLALSTCHGMGLLSSAGGKSLQTSPPASQTQPVHPISGRWTNSKNPGQRYMIIGAEPQ